MRARMPPTFRNCIQCGRFFRIKTLRGLTCSARCFNKRDKSYNLDYYYRNIRSLRPKIIKKCALKECGQEFSTNRPGKKFCCYECARSSENKIKNLKYHAQPVSKRYLANLRRYWNDPKKSRAVRKDYLQRKKLGALKLRRAKSIEETLAVRREAHRNRMRKYRRALLLAEKLGFEHRL